MFGGLYTDIKPGGTDISPNRHAHGTHVHHGPGLNLSRTRPHINLYYIVNEIGVLCK